MVINEIRGDLIDILENNADVICHQVSNSGKMGSGISASIKSKYPYVYDQYSNYCKLFKPMDLLGSCLVTPITKRSHKFVANLFGQHMYSPTDMDSMNRAIKGLMVQCHILMTSIYETTDEQTRNKLITIAIPSELSKDQSNEDQERIWGMIVNNFAPMHNVQILKVI